MTSNIDEPRDNVPGELEAVAVIGMSGRFPGADDLQTFWHNLRDGVESVTFFTDDELLASGLSLAEIHRPNYVRAKPILSDIESFAASFFHMSPREAALTDPQHRIFLECAWEALEDAAYNPHATTARIALYAAASKNTYLILNLLSRGGWVRTEEVYQVLIGNEKDYLSSRVSYKLNLRGPSVTVQTACSSSLVAAHMACQSLLNYESDIALAGGVTIDTPHKSGYLHHAGDMLSPDGHCRTFDADAGGTVFGQGAGVVVLRRLKDALADGDNVYAVIRGSAINHDGFLKSSFTAPSIEGQASVVAEALAFASVDAETVSYVEAHGTATTLGDPIEVEALTRAFRTMTDHKQFCALGSVKTNIGHLNAAAGVAGMIKTILALKHRQIPPSLHFRKPNEFINFADSPFFVNTALTEWKDSPYPRRAGVSSFGQGGTNAHVVLEEAAPRPPAAKSRPYHFLPLSAHSKRTLDEASRRLRSVLADAAPPDIADAAFTLQVGRKHFSYRRVVLCANASDAVSALDGFSPACVRNGSPDELDARMTFVLHDSTPEHFKLPRALYAAEPEFRQEVGRFTQVCGRRHGFDVEELFTSSAASADDPLKQPAGRDLFPLLHFAAQYSLARLLTAWAGKPTAFIGIGLGELTGACLAGIIQLEDALAVLDRLTQATHAPSDASAMLDGISIRPPNTPLFSASTRANLKVEANIREYLGNLLVPQAEAAELTAAYSENSAKLFVHLRPGEGAHAPIRVTYDGQDSSEVNHDITLERGKSQQEEGHESRNLIAAVADLWLRGVEIDWRAFYAHEKRSRVSLPTYPFERQRFWVEPERNQSAHEPDSSPLFTSTPQAVVTEESADVQSPVDALAYPFNSTEKALARIFETTLGIKPVGVDDSFFDLGGDSLVAIQLIAEISATFGIELPMRAIFEKVTIRKLATLLDGEPSGQQSASSANELMHLNQEVFLDESIQVTRGLPVAPATPKDIFLTGATGFVGAYLLDQLLRHTEARIHCLVPAADSAEARERIRRTLLFYELDHEDNHARIRTVLGDLSQHLFGMSADAFTQLAADTDTIYHCGAQVNFVQSYRALKRTNVGGSQEVLRLAVTKKLKPVHHISSIAVFESDAFDGVSVAREDDDLMRGNEFHVGYSASKWVAEGLMNIARSRGVQVSVYRLSNVSGDSSTGIMPERHIIARFIKGCLQLGRAPAGQEMVNIIPVDMASRMVVELSLRQESHGGNFHVVHPQPTPLNNLTKWLQSRGYRLLPCTYEEWVKALHATSEGNEMKPFLPMFSRAALFSGRLYDQANTFCYLSHERLECRPIDNRLLGAYLLYLISVGYIDKPPLYDAYVPT